MQATYGLVIYQQARRHLLWVGTEGYRPWLWINRDNTLAASSTGATADTYHMNQTRKHLEWFWAMTSHRRYRPGLP